MFFNITHHHWHHVFLGLFLLPLSLYNDWHKVKRMYISSSISKAVESHCSSLDSVLAVMHASCRRQTHFTGESIQALKRGTALCHRESTFYSVPQCSHCKRRTSYGNSVCLSVCPSIRHMPVLSKRRHVARCSLHCQIAKCVQFCRNQKIFPRDDPFPQKSWLELTYPLLIAASLDTFCLIAPQG